MLEVIIMNILNNPTPLLVDVLEIKGIQYDVSIWDKLVFVCLILYGIVVVFSMGFITYTAYKWNKLYFYDKSIFRNFNLIGVVFTVIGILTFISSANTIQSEFHKVRIVEYTSLDFKDSIFIITIGMLFFLITAILKEAKRLKEENDLTI